MKLMTAMKFLSTIMKDTKIELTSKSLGKILNVLYHGLSINEIHIDDEEVLSKIYLPGQGPPMASNKRQPIRRLIGHSFAYNICPKMKIFNYFSRELATCLYAIIARLEVNWAQNIFDSLVRDHITSFPYGAFLTHVSSKSRLILPRKQMWSRHLNFLIDLFFKHETS